MNEFATTLEAVSSNKSKTVIKLSMSNAVAKRFTSSFLDSIDKELFVTFKNAQMEMNVVQNADGKPEMAVESYQVDKSGVVASVQQTEIGDDLDDEEVVVEHENKQDEESEESGGQDEESEEAEEEQQPEEDNDNWDEGPPVNPNEEQAKDQADDIDDEIVETYILEMQPYYEEFAFDMVAIAYERRTTGKTWPQMGKERQVTSGKLQLEYGKYKSRVRDEIKAKRGGAA